MRFNKRYCEKCAFEKLSFEDKAKANPEFMLDKVEKVDYVICPICGHRSRVLNNHLLYQHNMKIAEFKSAYPDSLNICTDESSRIGAKISGDKNPAYQHGGKFSPYSTKFIHYTEEYRQAAISKASENRSYNTQLEYYTNKGLSEQEALEALSKRQTTFSLDRCIEQYGEELGYEKWKERQEKWQNTLKSKSDEEIAEMNRKKISGGSISKSEKEIAEYIKSIFPETQTQLFLKSNNKCYLYDICVGNKIIEYNGCYWHASPNRFNADDVVRIVNECALTAQEIWDRDAVKLQVAKENGYEVLVIWECDLVKNKDETLNKCINFLTT